MNRNVQRLERLEATLKPSGIIVLALDDGEGRDNCIRRHGYEPSSRGVTYVVVTSAHIGGL